MALRRIQRGQLRGAVRTGGLALFIVGLAGIARRAALSTTPRADTNQALPAQTSSPLGLRRQALWLAAAFVPAGLLSATTN